MAAKTIKNQLKIFTKWMKLLLLNFR
jgi:hypothetical protein